jgi:transcriptional regulator GlxA family with amidase domain
MEHLYPKIAVQKGMRYVRSGRVIFTAGGLSSGIDLALHIVEQYYARDAADLTVTGPLLGPVLSFHRRGLCGLFRV